MSNKAQGLPINFIVLAALAILILILGASFVIAGGGSTTASISQAQIRNTCQNACVGLQNWAANKPSATATGAPATNYCKSYTVAGVGSAVNCSAPSIGSTCVMSFQDTTTCRVGTCTGANAITCV